MLGGHSALPNTLAYRMYSLDLLDLLGKRGASVFVSCAIATPTDIQMMAEEHALGLFVLCTF